MISLDNSASFVSTLSSPETNAFTVAAGNNRILIVEFAYVNGGGVTSVDSVTYNGAALTFYYERVALGPVKDNRVSIWYMLAPDVGTHDVVISYTGVGIVGVAISVTAYKGVDQVAPIEQAVPATSGANSANSLSLSFSTLSDSAFQHVAYFTGFSPGTFAATTGTLESQASSLNDSMAIVDRGPLGAAGSYSTAVTIGGAANDIRAVGFSLKPAAVINTILARPIFL